MKKRVLHIILSSVFSFFIHMSLILLLSLLLQQSCASKRFMDEEITNQSAKMRKVLVCSKNAQTCYGNLNILPKDIITNYILLKCDSNIIKVNRSFFTLVTGYKFEHIFAQGFEKQPGRPIVPIISNATINLKNLSQDIEKIPSFIWYSLVRNVKNIPSCYWLYLRGSYIQTINLSYNQISDKDARRFGESLRDTQVQTIYLSYNRIGDEGAQGFGESLKRTQVQIIYLNYNQIGNEGVLGLGKSLKGTQVQTIYLRYNKIGNEGAHVLVQSLLGTQVHTLDLSYNQISDEGACTLIQSLKGSQIQILDLRGNHISDEEIQEFRRSLKDTQIKVLL